MINIFQAFFKFSFYILRHWLIYIYKAAVSAHPIIEAEQVITYSRQPAVCLLVMLRVKL